MYTPSDDTFLLADCIRQYYGGRALEIGVGSGLLLNILEKNFAYVAGSDIDLTGIATLQAAEDNISKCLTCMLRRRVSIWYRQI